MGQALLRLCAESGQCAAAAAVTRSSPSQRVVDGVPFFASSELSGLPPFDVAVDFSLPEGFDRVLDLCLARNVALVSGTTGLSGAQAQALARASARIPVLWASNFSLGVAVLNDLVARAAAALPGWNCDVVEAHHTRKQDAPSGTAITLGETAAAAGAQVSYASLRAGDIVGEHTVQFAGLGERIELIHRAGNRDIFARGAMTAAYRLAGLPPGAYTMADVLFSKD